MRKVKNKIQILFINICTAKFEIASSNNIFTDPTFTDPAFTDPTFTDPTFTDPKTPDSFLSNESGVFVSMSSM